MATEDFLNQYQDNILQQDQQEGPGKPKRPSPTLKKGPTPGASAIPLKLSDIAKAVGNNPVAPAPGLLPELESGRQTNIDLDAYEGYMGGAGVVIGADNDRRRAANQGFWESTGLRLGNFVPNVVAGLLENTGYLGALVSEQGDERDYSNALTELAKEMKNPLGDVYRENPNETWDFSDPAWWGDHFWNLAESAAQFGITGAGVGSLFGRLAMQAGRLGATAGKIGQGIGQVATAGTLAYVEGAMSGADVFNKTYEARLSTLLNSGMDAWQADEQARGDAANAAATTVQLNTALATGLNMTGLAAMFKSNDDIFRAFTSSQALKRQAGEELGGWMGRLRNATTVDPSLANLLNGGSRMARMGHLGLEAGQESVEELINQFAERTGYAQGESGRRSSFVGQFAELSNFFDRTMNSEGALSAVLGALGGVTQTVVLDNIPMHKVPITNADGQVMEANGKAATRIVTSHQRNAMGAQQYYTRIVDAIEHDVKTYQDQTTRLAAAIAAGNQEEAQLIRDNIFDARLYNSIMTGQGSAWVAEMDRIASLNNSETVTDKLTPELQALVAEANQAQADGADQATLDQYAQKIRDMNAVMYNNGLSTEASDAGFSTGTKDNAFKAKAEQAKKDIISLEAEWNRLNSQYNSPEEQALNYPAFIFQKRADIFRRDNILRQTEQDINMRDAEVNRAAAGVPNAIFLTQLMALESIYRAQKTIMGQVKALNKAIADGDMTGMEMLVKKMGGSTELKNLVEAAEDLVMKATDKIGEMSERGFKLEQTISGTEGFLDFKQTEGKGKKPEEQLQGYIDKQAEAINQMRNKEALAKHRHNYEVFKADTEMARQSADFFETSKGRKKYLRETKASQAETARVAYEEQRRDALARIREQADDAAAAELEANKNKTVEQIIQTKIMELKAQKAELIRKKEEVLKKIRSLFGTALGNQVGDFFGGKARRLENIRHQRSVLAGIEQDIRQIDADIAFFNDQLQNVQTAATVAATPVGSPTPPVTTPSPVPPVTSPTQATQAVNSALTAEEEFNNYLETLSPAAAKAATEKINDWLAWAMLAPDDPIPGNLFAIEVQSGILTPEQAGRLITLARNMQTRIQDIQGEEIAAGEEAEVLTEEVRTEADAVITDTSDSLDMAETTNAPEPDEEPFTDKTQNLDELSDRTKEELYAHQGAKAVDVNKIQNTALEYDERRTPSGDYRIVSVSSSIREGYPASMVRPGSVQEGDELILLVDEGYDGTVNADTEMNTEDRGAVQVGAKFEDYTDGQRVTDIGNVPIRIIFAKTGETLGYVPRLGWLNSQYEGATNHRNIVDLIVQEDQVIDNLEIQREKLMAIRTAVANDYNNSPQGSGMVVKVQTIGPGRLIYQTHVTNTSARIVDGLTMNRIPAPNIQFARASNGKVYVGKNSLPLVQVDTPIPPTWTNLPGLLVPMYNGTYAFSPVRMRAHTEADINTVTRAIELFLQNRANPNNPDVITEAEKILSTTSIDIRSPQGLRQFVNQYYTYTEGFSKGKVVGDVVAMQRSGVTKPFFMLDIRDNGDIKVGWAYSGRKIVYAILETNGTLANWFREQLAEGLGTRTRNMTYNNPTKGMRGINDGQGIFTEVQYNKAGRWVASTHGSYNEYLKNISYTPLVGTNTVEGRYVYAVNPQITYDVTTVAPVVNTVEEEKPTWSANDEAEAEKGLTDAELLDLDNIFGVGLLRIPRPVNSVGTDPEAQSLSLASLQEMYNFTPIEQQNGKSPQQVLEELSREGIGQLAPGFNPFKNCP